MLLFRKSATTTAWPCVARGSISKPQHTVIKAFDRVTRRLSRNPKLAASVFLHIEAILPSLCHLALRSIVAM